jgi:hypothetical protein
MKIGIMASQISGHLTFQPSSITGLKAWYDPSDTTSITSSSGKVSQINDKSGNGYNLVQATSANQPTTGTRTINSLNVLDYTAVVQTLINGTPSNWTFMSNTSGSSIFAVFKFDNLSQRNGVYYTGYNPQGYTSTSTYFTALQTSGYVDHLVGDGAGNLNFLNRPSSGYAASTNYYVTVLGDPGNATAANRSKVYINTGSALAANTQTYTAGTAAPKTGFSLGGYLDNGQTPFTDTDGALDGVIGEVIVYTGVLSGADQTTVKNYLATKWGI